jgi:predicted HTH transcriptional regulator
VYTEVNELDWKSDISPRKDRLTSHLSAFANHPGGGFLVFGVRPDTASIVGVTTEQAASIVDQLANLGREAVEPPLVLDHSVVDWDGVPLLFVYIPEQAVKPVHLRGKTIEHTWIRSGASTRKASRQEVGAMMLHSQTPCWEKLRATAMLAPKDAVEWLDLGTIARMLKRPLPNTMDELLPWMVSEGIVEFRNAQAAAHRGRGPIGDCNAPL